MHVSTFGILQLFIVLTDHPDDHWLWGQDTKDVDRTDAVRWVCSPGHLLLCLASSKSELLSDYFHFKVQRAREFIHPLLRDHFLNQSLAATRLFTQ